MQSARVRAVRDAASAAASGPESKPPPSRLAAAFSSDSSWRESSPILWASSPTTSLCCTSASCGTQGAAAVGVSGEWGRGAGAGGEAAAAGGGRHLLGEAPEASLQRVFVQEEGVVVELQRAERELECLRGKEGGG